MSVAEVQEKLGMLHPESRAALEKTARNHCPFGCTELDDFGYCHHLVGFTNDGKTYEPVASLYRTSDDGVPYDTGFKTVQGQAKVEKTDILVNPKRLQVDKGVAHEAKAWVSDRVYRESAKKAPPLATPTVKPNELHSLKVRQAELEKRLAEKQARERIAELEAKLEEHELDQKTRPNK